MKLSAYPRVLWRWKWLVVVITLTCGATSLLASLQLPKIYGVSATALVSPKQLLPPSGGTTLADNPNQLPNVDQLVDTYIGMINSVPVRDSLARSGIPRSADQIAPGILAIRVPNTTLIRIAVHDQDPAVALSIGKEIIPAFNSSLDQLQQQVGVDQKTHLDSLVPWELPRDAPTVPVQPDIPRNVLLALGAGLIAAIALAFGLERLDNTVKEDSQVRSRLGLPLLATVRYRSSRRSAQGGEAVETIAARHVQGDALSEQYRALRTNVLFSGVNQSMKTLLVTSTMPGEGKTTTACNLALVMAQAGSRVVLVDADFRRPALHRVFARARNRGLGELLLGIGTEKEVLEESGTANPNLSVICSGPSPPNPSELLGSLVMQRVLARLGNQADYVILDSPPVSAVTDATVLAALLDGVILVVEQGGTAIPKIENALETLQGVGATVIGVVLNKARRAEAGFYYYYAPEERSANSEETRPATKQPKTGTEVKG